MTAGERYATAGRNNARARNEFLLHPFAKSKLRIRGIRFARIAYDRKAMLEPELQVRDSPDRCLWTGGDQVRRGRLRSRIGEDMSMGIDEARDDGIPAQVNHCIAAAGRRGRDRADPMTGDGDVSVGCNVSGANINEFAGMNNPRFRCRRLLGTGLQYENRKQSEKKTSALYQASVLRTPEYWSW